MIMVKESAEHYYAKHSSKHLLSFPIAVWYVLTIWFMPTKKSQIHPCQKEEVGKRLAYLALNKTYQYGSIACEYPSYWNMSIQSDTVELIFHHADEGLSPWKDIKGSR